MKKTTLISGIILSGLLLSNSSHAMSTSEHDAAKKLSSQGIIASQNSAAGYKLSSSITRKEIMKVVMNLSGKSVADQCNNTFGDVINDWGCKYIESALSNGFIAKNTSFRPNDTITKAESMKLILKARGIEKNHNGDDWRENYMLTAYDTGLITDKYTDHDTKATRGWIFSAAVGNSVPIEETGDVTDDIIENMIEDIMEDDANMMTDEENGYKTYSKELIGKNNTTVLFFNATWCPSCVAMNKKLNATSFDGEDILILSVDYDANAELKTQYGVTSQHTFVQVDSEGELLKKWVGGNDLDAIKAKIK